MKKILIISLIFILTFSFMFNCVAISYDDDIPDYVPFSGGAFIACHSTIGEITIIVPFDFQKDCFGFVGNGSNVCNLRNSTISGSIYTSGGQTYACRFTRLNTLEYQVASGYSYTYEPVTINSVISTNVLFADDTDLNRQNDNYYFSRYEKIAISLLLVLNLSNVFMIIKKGRVK